MTDEERLAAAVPPNVREVCAKLAAAGHQAVAVGGAVRDALLGRTPGDWDVATSAHPDQVTAMFRHTAQTGIEHGTVTVVTGRGKESHVEVTTFRGEGAYSDARRPDTVTFGVPLHEDLARRDLTINAIAYDPGTRAMIDPFDGRGDLARGLLRAVGDPVARFTEDGLRVMRAVRFAAQLELALDPRTEAAIPPALPSLAKVSRERVHIELRKLLAAPLPSRGLGIAERTGIVASILPDLRPDAAWLARIDRAQVDVRLAALLVPMAGSADPRHVDHAVVRQIAALLRALKASNAEADTAAALVGAWHACREPAWTPAQARRLASELRRDDRALAISLWSAEPSPNAALITAASDALTAPLSIGDLAIGGTDLMTALAIPAGPAIGQILAALLDRVLDDPAINQRDTLIELARTL